MVSFWSRPGIPFSHLITGWLLSMSSFRQRLPLLHIMLITAPSPRGHKGVLWPRHSRYLLPCQLTCSASKFLYHVHSVLFPIWNSVSHRMFRSGLVSGASRVTLWTWAGELGCGSQGAKSKNKRNLGSCWYYGAVETSLTLPAFWLFINIIINVLLTSASSYQLFFTSEHMTEMLIII